ncbi:unnamed protein product [Hymenolepis diminuta]|uniref:Uncharacterized protein n=1 Tax=Hymenolepis diminuta TaxID=6216 RepID=A0A564XZG4_HYMDI|nr:unnamed protein product [Hymenolepis diminuta]
MSRRVHRVVLFSVTVSLHIKGTSAVMLWRGLSLVIHIKLPLFSKQHQRTSVSYGLRHILFISSLPQHAALPLSVTCGSLDCIFGLINSWCSAPQFLLAITQTATNW